MHLENLLSRLFWGCVVILVGNPVVAQTTFEFNAIGDLEFSIAGKNSHYYYNEIDKDRTEARIGLAQLNLLSKVNFGPQWSLNTRLLLERDKGQQLNKFGLPQLNVQWLSKKRALGVTLGNFINPFGSFNQKQLSTDRNFIGLPLAYSYYQNISGTIGFVPGMGDVTKVSVDGVVQWGTSNIYYGGYTSGALFSWNIKPAKVNWKIALVSGASNLQKRFTNPLHLGVISKLKVNPTYFWEQGFSVSHGSFFQSSEVSDQLDDPGAFTQTIIGTDYKLGTGYFELSGEVMTAFYTVPQYNAEKQEFESDPDGKNIAQHLSNFSAYLDIKFEPPMIQGSYIAYRIDHLSFGEAEGYQNQNWDNNVLRHSLAIGYHINRFVLARMAISTQQVDEKKWDRTQRTFRFVLTAHY